MTTYTILDKSKRRYLRFGHLPHTVNNPRVVITFADRHLTEQFIHHNLNDYPRLRYAPTPLTKRRE